MSHESGVVEFPAKRRSIIKTQLAEQDILISGIEFDGDAISLAVSTDWRPRFNRWALVRRYLIREAETKWNGRSFSVKRTDGTAELPEQYYTFIPNDPDDIEHCDCPAHAKANYCIHVDVVRWIITNFLE